MPPIAPDPPRPIPEDRGRAVLQAIARGRVEAGRPIRAVEAQDLARRALVETGDDWTRRGTA